VRTISFYGGVVQAPDGWADITQELDPGMPTTLVQLPDELGSLQFSVALYTSGERPNFSAPVMTEMIRDLIQKRTNQQAVEVRVVRSAERVVVSADCKDNDFNRLWYLSDGLNLALITYVCDLGEESELSDCEAIVASFAFQTREPGTKQ
jgi:hypothetical protein